MATLQTGAARLTSQNLSARTEVRRLDRRITALTRTVAGLQSTAGTAQAQQHLTLFAEQAKKAADATISAVQSAQKPPGGTTPPPPQQ